ncbi:hypothetical protein GPECTOR_15g340 [Gonium pectorale]|uniref:Protein kinase domain-containing protein n=1 Tax=Gonium pectorale TaxID=33097 RepID=A0A150GLC0_GONPE|nr:hypothetical protein GPECTOR_15g340 [Gonium pectorale]|eukprot:KXZ50656.1 hypothetical protein GPECTOR_15g340 [Gonium pectorale]
MTAAAGTGRDVTGPLVSALGSCFYERVSTGLCKRIAGYAAIPGYDTPDGDILQVANTTAAAAEACSASTMCQAFTDKGVLKGSASPLIRTGGGQQCFYVKMPAGPCPSFPGFVAVVNVDHEQHNIKGTPIARDVAAVAAFCRAEPVCWGFNSDGYAKTSGWADTIATGTCFYVKLDPPVAVCPQLPGYAVAADMDHPGDDGPTYMASDVAQRCTADPSCLGFAYGRSPSGIVKRAATPLVPRPGSCFYTKIDTGSCPNIVGFVVAANTNYAGSDVIYYGASAPSLCRANPGCVGFNSNGFATSNTSPTEDAPGVCFYTRVSSGTCAELDGFFVAADPLSYDPIAGILVLRTARHYGWTGTDVIITYRLPDDAPPEAAPLRAFPNVNLPFEELADANIDVVLASYFNEMRAKYEQEIAGTAKPRPVPASHKTAQRPGESRDMPAAIRALQSELKDAELRVFSVLGAGSYGVVYIGSWRGLPAAVKTLVVPEAAVGKEGRARQRAVLEAAISMSMAHTNVVATYSYDIKPLVQLPGGESEGAGGEVGDAVAAYKLYIVQELCNGGTLCHALAQGTAGAVRAGGAFRLMALRLALDVAQGMRHVHGCRIVHGDLKPVRAKVADFGLSLPLAEGATHASQRFHGTPAYMAPEVATQGQLSPRADVWSFGLMLVELYYGCTLEDIRSLYALMGAGELGLSGNSLYSFLLQT